MEDYTEIAYLNNLKNKITRRISALQKAHREKEHIVDFNTIKKIDNTGENSLDEIRRVIEIGKTLNDLYGKKVRTTEKDGKKYEFECTGILVCEGSISTWLNNEYIHHLPIDIDLDILLVGDGEDGSFGLRDIVKVEEIRQ